MSADLQPDFKCVFRHFAACLAPFDHNAAVLLQK